MKGKNLRYYSGFWLSKVLRQIHSISGTNISLVKEIRGKDLKIITREVIMKKPKNKY